MQKMNPEEAKEVIRLTLETTSRLSNIAYIVKNSRELDSFDPTITTIGRIMAEIYFEIIEKIVRKFPELKPNELEL
jgi:hypothetical protein